MMYGDAQSASWAGSESTQKGRKGAGMEPRQSAVERYRLEAARLRQKATRVQTEAIRRQMQEIAQNYEKLAAIVEKLPLRRGGLLPSN